MTIRWHLIFIAILLFVSAQAQDTRQIVPEEFVKARQGKASTVKRPGYRRAAAKSSAPIAPCVNCVQLGMTVWRLRPSQSADAGARIIVHEGEKEIEWTPERVEAGARLGTGERVRFSFEAAQPGYLYVIDREQYADGTLGEPYLIFPTTRTRSGDNRVTPGHLVEIPAQDDRPNYFTLRTSRADQRGEMLTVIVTPQPLADVTVGERALKLSAEQVAKWEQTWGAKAERFEMAGGAGRAWTVAEQQAGADATRQLTQDEPGPQTVYRVAVKPGETLLVKVALLYGKSNRQPRRAE